MARPSGETGAGAGGAGRGPAAMTTAGGGAGGGGTPAMGGSGGADAGGEPRPEDMASGAGEAGLADALAPARDADPAPQAVPAALLAVGTHCPSGQGYGDPLPANPTIKMIKSGFSTTEGPVWHAGQQALFFTEFEGRAGRIHKYTPGDGKFIVFVNNVGVNGLALAPDGGLVAASQDMQRLTRFDVDTGMRSEVAGSASFMNRPFNAVNDVLVRGDGNMYFTDPTFLNEGRPGQGATAYYRLSPAGEVTRLGTGPQPNSLGISPDGRWLYITSSGAGDAKVWRHPLLADGSVGERTDFLSARSEGLAIDCAGNLYLSAAGKISVYTASGSMIRSFGNIAAGITSLAIGGPTEMTLYITARGAIYETMLNVPGLPN